MKTLGKKSILLAILAVAVLGLFVFTQSLWGQSKKTAKVADEVIPERPPIVWTPDHIQMDGDDTVSVTLTAQSPIPATQIEIVPALAPYISVSPATLPALPKGATQTLQIATKVPAGTPMDTIDGTLHIRLGSSTIARPLPIVLITWPPATIGDVTINYPPILITEVIDSEAVVLRYDQPTGEEGPVLSVVIDHNHRGLTAEQYYDGDPGPDLSDGTVSPITVAGRPSLRFVPASTLAGAVVVVVPGPGEFLRVTDSGVAFQETGLFNAILDTVRF